MQRFYRTLHRINWFETGFNAFFFHYMIIEPQNLCDCNDMPICLANNVLNRFLGMWKPLIITISAKLILKWIHLFTQIEVFGYFKVVNPALLLVRSQKRRCGAISRNSTHCGVLKFTRWHSIGTRYLMYFDSHCNLNIFARKLLLFSWRYLTTSKWKSKTEREQQISKWKTNK